MTQEEGASHVGEGCGDGGGKAGEASWGSEERAGKGIVKPRGGAGGRGGEWEQGQGERKGKAREGWGEMVREDTQDENGKRQRENKDRDGGGGEGRKTAQARGGRGGGRKEQRETGGRPQAEAKHAKAPREAGGKWGQAKTHERKRREGASHGREARTPREERTEKRIRHLAKLDVFQLSRWPTPGPSILTASASYDVLIPMVKSESWSTPGPGTEATSLPPWLAFITLIDPGIHKYIFRDHAYPTQPFNATDPMVSPRSICFVFILEEMICRSHDWLLVHHEHPRAVVGVHESLMMSGRDILVDIEEAMAGGGA
nr:hypothetical protein Iba_chr01bCG16350 [Ipomoea batatas]